MVVYQAVPQPADALGPAVRVVLVLDVPRHREALAADAARLADEFGTTLSHLIPGIRARKAVVSSNTAPKVQTGLMVDHDNRRVSVDGVPVRLAYREFALLAYLTAVPHRTISRTTLLQHVWSDRNRGAEEISGRTVDTHIRRLRAKLGDYAHVLTTVRGHGYRFDPSPDTRLRSHPTAPRGALAT